MTDIPQTGAGKVVCVTGASGFIASHIVKQLLCRGYTVHATVRDAGNDEKYGWVKKLGDGTTGKLELFSADLNQAGSFDVAVEGCEYVCQVAAVVEFSSKNPKKDIVDPSVEGTRNVLNSVIKAKAAKRVVLTSSIAAVCDSFEERGKTYSEDDWHHELSLKNPYPMAKTIAEKLAWKMHDDLKAKGGYSFELVVINPALVLGDILHESHGRRGPATMVSDMLDGTMALAPDFHWSIVHVRDVAMTHILAMETEEASGRYIASDDSLTSMLDIAKILKTEYPLSKAPTLPMPTALLYAVSVLNPKMGLEFVQRFAGSIQYFSNKRAKTELGVEFGPPHKAILDTAKSFYELGIVAEPSTTPRNAFAFLPSREDIVALIPGFSKKNNTEAEAEQAPLPAAVDSAAK